MWLLFNWIEQLNSVKQSFLLQTIKYLIWKNTQDLKKGSCYKKVKISYEAVSNSKFDTDDVQISFRMFDLIWWNFILYFRDFNGTSTRKEDLQMIVLKYKEKKRKFILVITGFSNNESANPPTVLKAVSTLPLYLTKSINVITATSKNTCKRMLIFYKKGYCLRACHEICSWDDKHFASY